MEIEREVRSSNRATERPSHVGHYEMERIERELQHLQQQCALLEEEAESSAGEKRCCIELAAQMRFRREGVGEEILCYVMFLQRRV